MSDIQHEIQRRCKRVKADSFDGTGIGAVIDFVGAHATPANFGKGGQ